MSLIGRRSGFDNVILGLSLRSELRRSDLISGRAKTDWKNKGKVKKARARPWLKVEGKHMSNRDGERERLWAERETFRFFLYRMEVLEHPESKNCYVKFES